MSERSVSDQLAELRYTLKAIRGELGECLHRKMTLERKIDELRVIIEALMRDLEEYKCRN